MNQQRCPGCGNNVSRMDRYPRYLCSVCVGNVTDKSGNSIPIERLYPGYVYLRRRICTAREAYMGGIVVEMQW